MPKEITRETNIRSKAYLLISLFVVAFACLILGSYLLAEKIGIDVTLQVLGSLGVACVPILVFVRVVGWVIENSEAVFKQIVEHLDDGKIDSIAEMLTGDSLGAAF